MFFCLILDSRYTQIKTAMIPEVFVESLLFFYHKEVKVKIFEKTANKKRARIYNYLVIEDTGFIFNP